MYNYTVNKVSWGGLHIPIESFKTLKEAEEFCDSHKDFTFVIIDSMNQKIYKRMASRDLP